MSIISPSIFVGEINIPNTDDLAVNESVQIFINEYEDIFLQKLMGKDVYAAYRANPTSFTQIIDQAKPLIAYYVYYWVMDDQNTYNSGTQIVKSKNENSSATSAFPKMVKAWNKMVRGARELRKLLFDEENGFLMYVGALPDCVCDLPFRTRYCTYTEDIFNYKNTLGV